MVNALIALTTPPLTTPKLTTPPLTTPPQAAESKRHDKIDVLQKQTRHRNAHEMLEWERRKSSRESEARKKEHEERVKQLVVRTCGTSEWSWLRGEIDWMP